MSRRRGGKQGREIKERWRSQEAQAGLREAKGGGGDKEATESVREQVCVCVFQ